MVSLLFALQNASLKCAELEGFRKKSQKQFRQQSCFCFLFLFLTVVGKLRLKITDTFLICSSSKCA